MKLKVIGMIKHHYIMVAYWDPTWGLTLPTPYQQSRVTASVAWVEETEAKIKLNPN